ncbi:trypco2 family protein [Streptomyces sp. NPDC020917]|uniref:trypco2 family protein n=1 Tax=Streptomyces sp. NPDC020917 TaxID=3365102 RepID=UPI0037971FD1
MTTQDEHVEPAAVSGMDLADAVEAVRQGLMAGAARGAGQGLRFEVGEIRMDFTVQLQRARTGRGGVRAWVVDAGADLSRTDGRTHTVSFTLRPVDAATGHAPLIGAPDEGDISGLAQRG